MSKIQEQIKALQLKQKKIEYLSYIADLIKNDTKCVDFKDVQEEIVSKFEPFILELMTQIETESLIKKDKSEELTTEEITVLKSVVKSILTKKSQPETPAAPAQPHSPYSSEPQPPPAKPQAPQQELSNNDKMAFALGNRHLANKKVQVINDKNVTITGTVVGLDAPNVVVKTDSGPVIHVPIEKVVLQS